MKILVTGGTGSVGRTAVKRLVENGHQVQVIGRRAGIEIDGAQYRQCDITDFDLLRKQVKGMEGIVHLAAIPSPGRHPASEVFHINCSGTFNVYQAAAQEGIGKISCASSINALGFNYGRKPFPISYFPIDEEHPTFTTDPYSFSKQITEQIADYFWRRENISSVNLRFPGVYEVNMERLERWRKHAARFKKTMTEFLAQPKTEQRERIQRAIARFDATRPDRAGYLPREEAIKRWRTPGNDPDLGLLMGGFGRSNFWASVDARDSAQALEKGLLADYEGSHPLFINSSHNAAGIKSETLLQVFFPEVQERKRPLPGTESLVSIEKARKLIGFEPEYSVLDLLE